MDNIKELNRVLVIRCLPYIHLATDLCYTNLAYSKETYVLYAVDMWNNIIVLESSMMFYVTCNCVTVCDSHMKYYI